VETIVVPNKVGAVAPEPADADPRTLSAAPLGAFYRDVRPGDWRNRPLPRLRRWCHAVDFPLASARRDEAMR
jgi:hypothetical protein